MKIGYNGQVYDLDLEHITLKQAMVVESYTGLPIFKLVSKIVEDKEDSPDLLKALGALYWLMHQQDGDVFPIADADFPVMPFLEAVIRALIAEVGDASGGEAEPVPPTVSSPASSPSPPAAAPSPPLALNGTGEVSAPSIAS